MRSAFNEVNDWAPDLTCGRFRWNRGPAYSALCSKYFALNDAEINDQETFLERCSNLPGQLQLYYKHVEHMPEGWPEEIHGPFPEGGLGNLLYYSLVLGIGLLWC